ncbi:MAG: PBSX family phage terminase large subunit [Paludibacteraceae bacterium]|nr:PBSX family phage terminase large subunit [Paludibacteraceae bacterium]
MAINLTIKKSLFIPKFYPYLLDYGKRWEFWCGSAGSGKSYFLTQRIIVRCCREKIRFVVCRRYGTTLRNSVFALFKEVLAKWQLTQYVKIKETDMSIHFPNGSSIILLGLDEETKLLSLANISGVWVEEAYEVPQNLIEQLNLRMRGQASNQQIWLSWNPISKNSYLYKFSVEEPPENSTFIHSTFRDNPFLNKEYVDSLMELYTRNPAKARIFCDGEWGVDTEGLVITNWRSEEFDHMALAAGGLEHRVGMDLGWTDPSAIIDSLYDRQNRTIYVFNEFYKSGCQLSELAQAIKNMNLQKSKIFVDAAEPRSIQFFKTEGINAVACAKSKDSVKAGLMFLQDHLIIVHPKCKNFIIELENFSYIKSKQTGEWTEATTHEYSHAIDSLRYGYSDIYTNTKLKTLDKSVLSL